ncbi:MAG: alanine--glyoxylate aminotransferase family protein [Vicinamibacterales bacterium]|nr:alanine--glyoxylate aminotransferase family protein [Vicinamibacterales bacterium]
MLPSTERLLLGPGPSLIAPRVMRALGAPMLSHLDPDFVVIMDDLRARLERICRAPEGSFAFAMSGTGTSGMEVAVSNLVQPGTRVLSIVSGYFGDRLAQMSVRYGGEVEKVAVDWGRAVDPDAVRTMLGKTRAEVVTVVHAETSTGVLNPLEAIATVAREHDALVLVDAVTSLGGHPLDADGWGLDAVYSCSQKCLGSPSGLSPVLFGPLALERLVPCRGFYFDLELLEDYWLKRKYHHTMSASLIYALSEALTIVEEEGLEARWARHERHHRAFAAGLEAMGLSLLPPEGERLWTLNAIRVPEGIDDAAVRKHLLTKHNMEIGAGLGPLAGKIFRVGLMGASSTPELVTACLTALEDALAAQGFRAPAGAGAAAATAALA